MKYNLAIWSPCCCKEFVRFTSKWPSSIFAINFSSLQKMLTKYLICFPRPKWTLLVLSIHSISPSILYFIYYSLYYTVIFFILTLYSLPLFLLTLDYSLSIYNFLLFGISPFFLYLSFYSILSISASNSISLFSIDPSILLSPNFLFYSLSFSTTF